MREYVEQQVTRNERRCVRRTCDLCGAEGKADDWDGVTYSINETEVRVEVRQKQGSNYPDCGFGTEIVVDICPRCFKDRLVPWLESQGARVQRREWDW